ncbi:MAG: cellulose binding domain-containing protein [Polyangiaceae bacterium]
MKPLMPRRYCTMALVASLFGCASNDAHENGSVVESAVLSSDGVLDATLSTNSWGAGYCTNVTLTNKGSSTISSWKVTVNLNGATLSNSWSATYTTSGGLLTITPLDWNKSLGVNASTTLGFCANGSATPVVDTVNQTGGSGGSGGTGGTSSVGGSTARGGSSALGGTTARGGSSSLGGTTARGGTSSVGGTTSTGGTAGSAGTPVLTGQGTLTSNYASAAVGRDGRNYVVQNNVWGGSGTQTVSYKGTTFEVTQQTGSNAGNGAPVSYPSVFIGSNYNRTTAGSNLPKLVSSIASVQTSWTNNAGGPSGTYNAAYDVWFSTSASGDSGAPSGGYLMVWYFNPSGAQPIGSVVATAAVAGKQVQVWFGYNGSTPCVSYVIVGNTQSFTYDLNLFIKDAVQRGYVKSNWYLTNVFAGFEIWNGGAGLRTTDFYAIVN